MVASFYKWLIIPAIVLFSRGFLVPTPNSQLPTPNSGYHPIFVCVTEINHNNTDKTLEISLKIFVDDFEKVLSQKNKSIVSIAHPKDQALLHTQITQYVNEHLSLKIDGKEVTYKYIGYEKEEDAVYCYFEVANVNSVKKFEATDSMLHDLNTNQINIMHVTVDGHRQSKKMDYPESSVVLDF